MNTSIPKTGIISKLFLRSTVLAFGVYSINTFWMNKMHSKVLMTFYLLRGTFRTNSFHMPKESWEGDYRVQWNWGQTGKEGQGQGVYRKQGVPGGLFFWWGGSGPRTSWCETRCLLKTWCPVAPAHRWSFGPISSRRALFKPWAFWW